MIADREVVAARRRYASGVTVPDTTLSPRPKVALTTISSRAPVTGFALKTTPDGVGRDEPLDEHGGALRRGGEAGAAAVLERAVAGERGDAAGDRPPQLVGAGDTEEGVVLAGERRVGAVLVDRRRAHGDGRVVDAGDPPSRRYAAATARRRPRSRLGRRARRRSRAGRDGRAARRLRLAAFPPLRAGSVQRSSPSQRISVASASSLRAALRLGRLMTDEQGPSAPPAERWRHPARRRYGRRRASGADNHPRPSPSVGMPPPWRAGVSGALASTGGRGGFPLEASFGAVAGPPLRPSSPRSAACDLPCRRSTARRSTAWKRSSSRSPCQLGDHHRRHAVADRVRERAALAHHPVDADDKRDPDRDRLAEKNSRRRPAAMRSASRAPRR